jgi:hypothetical protein
MHIMPTLVAGHQFGGHESCMHCAAMRHLHHLVSLDALQGSLSSTRKEGKVVILWGGKEHRAANIQVPITTLMLDQVVYHY